MRVSSIQPSIYKSTPRNQHYTNVTSKGWKGAIKGAGGFGGTMGVITACVLGGPAGLLIGGVTALIGAAAGSGIEEDNKRNKEEEKEKKS